MKNILSVILIAFCLWSCSDEKAEETPVATGNIYGTVTVKRTAEPMRAAGIELYYNNLKLFKTVTYDDGHYGFDNMKVGPYEVRVVAEGYADARVNVVVEDGRTVRADIQLTEASSVAAGSTGY